MLELNFNPFPAIETDRLVLRQITHNDVNEMLALRSDDRVMKYIDRPRATTIADALDQIQRIIDSEKSNEGIAWAITLKPDETMIGYIGYWRIEKENYRPEIGYLLNHDFQRRGIMNEALSAVVDFGFRKLNFHTIKANVNPQNTASIKLLEKNSFAREAYFREDFFYQGKFLDSAIYCLVTPYK